MGQELPAVNITLHDKVNVAASAGAHPNCTVPLTNLTLHHLTPCWLAGPHAASKEVKVMSTHFTRGLVSEMGHGISRGQLPMEASINQVFPMNELNWEMWKGLFKRQMRRKDKPHMHHIL